MSFGHLRRTLSPCLPITLSSRHASTTARANKYCTKTSLLAGKEDRETRSKSENCRQPEGETHTLAPRPLPVNWCDARETRGVGRTPRNSGFLRFALGVIPDHVEQDVLIQHCLCTCHDLTVYQCFADTPGISMFWASFFGTGSSKCTEVCL